MADRFSYSLGQFSYQNNGYRENNDLKNNLYNLFAQVEATPDLNLQAEYRYRETTTGDLASRFDGSFHRFERREINQNVARVGALFTITQNRYHRSVIYTDRDSTLMYPKYKFYYRTQCQRLSGGKPNFYIKPIILI